MDPLKLFFLLQLERIKFSGTQHTPGPKKPNLAQQELALVKRK